jgi:hypothetical protein
MWQILVIISSTKFQTILSVGIGLMQYGQTDIQAEEGALCISYSVVCITYGIQLTVLNHRVEYM